MSNRWQNIGETPDKKPPCSVPSWFYLKTISDGIERRRGSRSFRFHIGWPISVIWKYNIYYKVKKIFYKKTTLYSAIPPATTTRRMYQLINALFLLENNTIRTIWNRIIMNSLCGNFERRAKRFREPFKFVFNRTRAERLFVFVYWLWGGGGFLQ